MNEQKLDDIITRLELALERANCIVDVNLVDGYFSEVENSGQKEDTIKGYYLLNAYPDGQTAVTIVQDYIMRARKLLTELRTEVQG